MINTKGVALRCYVHVKAVDDILVLLQPGLYKMLGPYSFLGMTRLMSCSFPSPFLIANRFLGSESIFKYKPFEVSVSYSS